MKARLFVLLKQNNGVVDECDLINLGVKKGWAATYADLLMASYRASKIGYGLDDFDAMQRQEKFNEALNVAVFAGLDGDTGDLLGIGQTKKIGTIPEGPNPGGEARVPGDNLEGAGDAPTKPYATSRPKYGKTQVNDVWNNYKDPTTDKAPDPAGGSISWDKTKPRQGQWDMGHIPGEKYSDMRDRYIRGEISQKEFLEWYRNPANYRPELPSTNRSHKYE